VGIVSKKVGLRWWRITRDKGNTGTKERIGRREIYGWKAESCERVNVDNNERKEQDRG
jgi:hypothetical protein